MNLKKLKVIITVIIIIDAIIITFLFQNRAFSHLAIWNIVESDKFDDFYWRPQDAPEFFRFEPKPENLSIFRNEISPFLKNGNNELGIALKTAKYVQEIKAENNLVKPARLKWDSPLGLLRQIRAGANGANCFHRAILLSTYLFGLGIKSRLWALENEKFNAPAHTINEVYIEGFKKWVFIDVMLGFYVTENGNPLSLLELRERLLNNQGVNISVNSIGGGIDEEDIIPLFYPKLIKCVFLRTSSDFSDKYNYRYGFLSMFNRQIDTLPDNIRIGLAHLLGRQNILMHYTDEFSKSLKSDIITAKALFYFLVSTIFFIGALCGIFCLIGLNPNRALEADEDG